MTVVFPVENEAFTIRIYKRLTTNPALIWANMYEVRTVGEASQNNLLDAALALVNFEEQFHLLDVEFDRAVISTIAPDGEPYNPTTFFSANLTGLLGNRDVGPNALSLNHVLFVRRVVGYGQAGKLYYRRCLGETDILSPGGTQALEQNSTIRATVTAAATALAASNILGSASSPIAMIMTAQGQVIRNVLGLSVAGTRIVQFNNRYYDVP